MQSIRIRPFTSSDYPAVQEILNGAFPEAPVSLEVLRAQYQNQDPIYKFQRWVAIYDRHVVAYGLYDQSPLMYHSRKFLISVVVHPDYESKGIGSEMYERIINALRPFNPLSVQAIANETRKRSVEFLKAKGFQEEQREYVLSLDVSLVDPVHYKEIDEKIHTQSIQIKTLRELEAEQDYDDRLHKLYNDLVQDMPAPEPITSVSYVYFKENMLNNTNLIPEAYFVAVHDHEYIGMNVLYTRPGKDHLFNEFTGVKQQYRHKHIALALKLRSIAYARANGYSTIKTYNHASNDPILKLNEHLGFVKEPANITFAKILSN